MKELSTEIEISAPAGKGWAILTTLSQFAEWNPLIREAEGEVREGAQLRIRIEPPGGKGMTFKPTVTRVLPEREFRWLGRFLLPALFEGEHIFELTPLSESRIRFVHREQFSGLLPPFLWGSLESSTRQGFEEMNAALKKEAEEERR